jgi:hypothetical protein
MCGTWYPDTGVETGVHDAPPLLDLYRFELRPATAA